MNRSLEHAWLRMALLLTALAAGALLTQFVPTYEEMAALRDQPAPTSSASKSSDAKSHPVSQAHAQRRQPKSAHRNT